jgi:hypothetical protein
VGKGIKRVMNKPMASLAFATALVAGTALVSNSASAATVFFNSLPPTSGGIDNVTPTFGPIYASFSTDAGKYNQLQVQLLLQGSTDAGGVWVSLLSNSGNTPGGFLTTIGTISDTQLTGGLATLSLTTSYLLAATTRYWVELSDLNATSTSATWSYSSNFSGTGVSGEFFSNDHKAVYTNSTENLPYQMEVSGSVSATPLPSTWLMLLTGFVGFGFLAYRGTKKGSAAFAAV